MSSQIEQDEFIEGLREDGILDGLKSQMSTTEAPVEEETETVEEPAEEPEVTDTEGDIEEPEVPAVPDVEPETEDTEVDTPPVEAEWTLDLTPETEEYLAKYDGDLNKALTAAINSQSLIGRQGNELGDVRRELQELRDAFTQQQQFQTQQPQPYQTYLPDPDEASEEEMAAAYSSLAVEAVERRDPGTLQQAVEAWGELQPFQASQFLTRLQQEAYREQLAAYEAAQGGDELQQRMEELKTQHPDLPEKVEAIGEEAARAPALGRLLYEGSPAERVNALEELYLRVANRSTTETSQQALRRVAVRQSEEARQARQQAQVASSGRGTVAAPEPTAQKIPLGRTGRFVDLNRVDEILQSDRI